MVDTIHTSRIWDVRLYAKSWKSVECIFRPNSDFRYSSQSSEYFTLSNSASAAVHTGTQQSVSLAAAAAKWTHDRLVASHTECITLTRAAILIPLHRFCIRNVEFERLRYCHELGEEVIGENQPPSSTIVVLATCLQTCLKGLKHRIAASVEWAHPPRYTAELVNTVHLKVGTVNDVIHLGFLKKQVARSSSVLHSDLRKTSIGGVSITNPRKPEKNSLIWQIWGSAVATKFTMDLVPYMHGNELSLNWVEYAYHRGIYEKFTFTRASP